MKKKEKINKLIDLIVQEDKDLYEDYKNGLTGHVTGIYPLEQMCEEHWDSDWCEENCECPTNFRKCIRKWMLQEDV